MRKVIAIIAVGSVIGLSGCSSSGGGLGNALLGLGNDDPARCQEYYDTWARVSPDTLANVWSRGMFTCSSREDRERSIASWEAIERGEYTAHHSVPGLPYNFEGRSYTDSNGSTIEVKDSNGDYYYRSDCKVTDNGAIICDGSEVW